MKRKFKEESNEEEESVKGKEKERKRQSRWGPQELKVEPKLEPKLELNDGQPLQLLFFLVFTHQETKMLIVGFCI